MLRKPTDEEIEELCLLHQKCGRGDLLDFIHGVKATAYKLDMTHRGALEFFTRAPEDTERN